MNAEVLSKAESWKSISFSWHFFYFAEYSIFNLKTNAKSRLRNVILECLVYYTTSFIALNLSECSFQRVCSIKNLMVSAEFLEFCLSCPS